MAAPQLVPPPVEIPQSLNTVEVYIIDTTSYMTGFPASAFFEPLLPGIDTMAAGSYSYLIKHPGSKGKDGTVLFDLGVRKDWENSPETFVAGIKASGASITVEKDVATILRENGQDLNDVGAIIWSHWHFDHAGDPQTFPATTDLIVGPGFKASIMPGYPTDRNSHVDQKAWAGRELREVDFSAGPRRLRIGGFRAHDFYGDGSFYLLDSPGHAEGHMSALARTTADPPSFVLLGGDIAHHCGQFRPSRHRPLPDAVAPNPLASGDGRHSHRRASALAACPGRIFLSIHPGRDPKSPFFGPASTGETWHHDAAEASRSIGKLVEADACDNIFPVLAHDTTLAGVIDLYPKPANEWMAKGWKEKTRWRFLGTFAPEEDVAEGTVQESQSQL
ncbi:hypothetical protein RB595_008844 [Gaeumannomyces hyphopodioides]